MEDQFVRSTAASRETPWYGPVIRVRYQETDRMGVVFHGNYVTWFEVGRSEWIRSLGTTYRELESNGLLLPVTDLHITYKQPAKYDDLVAVYTRLEEMSAIRMVFRSVVCRIDEQEAERLMKQGWVSQPKGIELVVGRTELAWVNGTNWRPTRLDRAHHETWSRLQQLVAET